MKLHALITAIAIAGFAGAATAGNPQAQLPALNVSAADVSGCTPPADAPACENFHRWIRANFSQREIGMLFGMRTSYPEYLTGGIDQLTRRYQARLREYVAAQNAGSAHVAAR
jgi:hypothetical protein